MWYDQSMYGPRLVLLLLGLACNVPGAKDTPSGDDSAAPAGDDTAGGGESGAAESGDDSSDAHETATGESGGTSETGDTGTATYAGWAEDDTRWRDVSDADAQVVFYGYHVGIGLAGADLGGADDVDSLLVLNSDTSYPVNLGYVFPGASAMNSTASATDWDGVVTIWDPDFYYHSADYAPAWDFRPVGDIDGDGIADLPYPQPTANRGPFVYSGATLSTARFPSGTADLTDADLTIEGSGDLSGDWFFWLTALGAPDCCGELQVSAYPWSAGKGKIWLYSLPQTTSSLALDDADALVTASRGLEAAGEVDLDGDGVPELLDTTSSYLPSGDDWAGLLVFDIPEEGASITDEDARLVIEGPTTSGAATYDYDRCGVMLPGDLDGDGLDDLVFRQFCPDIPGFDWCHGLVAGLTDLSTESGTIELYPSAAWSVVGAAEHSHLGRTATLVPDVDGDGTPEILTDSDWADTGYLRDFPVFLSSVVNAGGTFDETSAERSYRTTEDDSTYEGLGAADLDGDGNPELLIQYLIYGYGGAYIFSY